MHDKITATKDTKPFQDYLKFVANINIAFIISNTDKLLTIAHEFAHYTLHFAENRQELSKERKELEAETVACLLAERLELKSNSINYNTLY